MADAVTDRSYRALLAVPSLGRILLAMAVGRIAGAMISIAVVLFTLAHYNSPALAGLVTFASIAPGLLVSPIAGALLDRHGRARLVILDYLIGAASLVLIGVLALADSLPPWLLVAISAVASLTNPLSGTGLRSLFPIMVPEHLWERVNAVDSNAYIFSGLIGPPLAGAIVQLWGGPVAIVAIGFLFAAAALVLVGVRDPATEISTTGKLLVDAWQGLQYAWRNATIRGIGLAMTAVNLSGGVLVIVLPIIILNRLHEGPAVVGLVWAAAGVCGIATAITFGRRDSFGRERRWFTWSILGYAASTAMFLFQPDLLLIIVAMAIGGLANGPQDIAMFTLRQRRTDPAWMGRAFAVSMSFNFAGFPIGSAIAGALVDQSLEVAVAFAVIACLVGAFAAWFLIPAEASPTPAPHVPPEVMARAE